MFLFILTLSTLLFSLTAIPLIFCLFSWTMLWASSHYAQSCLPSMWLHISSSSPWLFLSLSLPPSPMWVDTMNDSSHPDSRAANASQSVSSLLAQQVIVAEVITVTFTSLRYARGGGPHHTSVASGAECYPLATSWGRSVGCVKINYLCHPTNSPGRFYGAHWGLQRGFTLTCAYLLHSNPPPLYVAIPSSIP